MRSSVLAGMLLLSSCGSSLGHHEALWAASGPTSYHYTYETGGFGAGLEMEVTVRSRAVSSTVVASPPGSTGQGFSVEQLFEDVRRRLDGPCKTTVEYDEILGYPRHAYSDCGMEGDGWTVQNFAADSAPDGGLP